MKLLHVVPCISPQSGGPTRSVKGLCRALSYAGMDVTLLVLEGFDEFDNSHNINVVRGYDIDFTAYDLVHIHGLWLLGLHRVAKACRNSGVKYIISPRGMLDPWSLSVKRWKKAVAMGFYQRRDIERASALHATAKDEAQNIRRLGFGHPIIIAPNGVDVPMLMPESTKKCEEKSAIFLSRLHPGKGLIMLAEAWAITRPQGWRMIVVGPDSYGHKKEVMQRLEDLGISREWSFIDMVSDFEKWRYYRMSDLLIHPSVSENFGITIAEGLAAGLPVICTKGTPWKEIEEQKCGWWIDISVESLAKALKEATSLTDKERCEMGKRGRRLVDEKYTWNVVAEKMIAGYGEVLYARD